MAPVSTNGNSPAIGLRPIGVTGLRTDYQGHVTEEPIRELQGERWRAVLAEMTVQDATVGSILNLVEWLTLQVEWRVDPADDQGDAAEEPRLHVETCLHDMSQAWEDTLSEIFSFPTWGWSWLEIVYKLRGGPDETRPEYRSKYNDGRIGWRKWAIRSQDSLYEWKWDDQGDTQAMVQLDPKTQATYTIPIEKSLLFRTTSRKGNPEGLSILRRAYRAWYRLKHIENIEGVGVERDLAGLPVAFVPPELLATTATADQQNLLAQIKKLVTSIRRDEQEGIVFPLVYDDKGHKLYDLVLLTSGGQRQFNTNDITNRYKTDMLRSVLADFLMLGSSDTGSWALSSDKTRLFAVAMANFLNRTAGVINRHAIPRLMRLNGWPLELAPTIEPGDIETRNLPELATFLETLVKAGMRVFPNPDLEKYLMEEANLPEPIPPEERALMQPPPQPVATQLPLPDGEQAPETDVQMPDMEGEPADQAAG